MAYSTTIMSGSACDVRELLRADAAAVLQVVVVVFLGDASLTPATIRDDAVHLC